MGFAHMNTDKHISYLIIDNDYENLLNIKPELERSCESLTVDIAFNLRDGLNLYAKTDYLLAAINIFLCTKDPFMFLASLKETAHTYLVVIIPEYDEQTIISSYENGADYVLFQNSSVEVNGAFFKAFYTQHLLQRSHVNRFWHSDIMEFQKRLIINPKYREVYVDNRLIELTAKEYDLLYYMAINGDQVLTMDQIIAEVWKYSYIYEGAVRSVIMRMRKKLEPNPEKPIFLLTVHGVGYKLCSYKNGSDDIKRIYETIIS